MQRTLIICLSALLILSSCKLIEDTTESEGGNVTSTIKVTAPNGGESLMEGSSFEIKWTGTTSSLLKIHYTVDNGSSWTLIADSLKNLGIYNWFPIPNIISNQCKVRVLAIDGSATDESDQAFAIVKNSNKSLLVTSPQKSDEWEAGSAKQIKWYSSGIDSVKIEYTANNGTKWNLITVDKKNTGIYYWEPIPNTPSTLAKVRIMDAKLGSPSSESEAFTILPEPVIRINVPNGGEQWLSGKNKTIEWASENIENVKISYTINNGYSWNVITQSTPSIGYYEWNNIPNQNSGNCKIRVEDALDGQPFDVSDSTFTITSQISLQLTSPNGGESWQSGTTHDLKWNSTGISNVNLEYSTNAGLTWNSITSNLQNTGAFTWTVPLVSNTSDVTQCLVRVSDASDESIYDVSDNIFTITPIPNITVTYPNGGETFLSNTSRDIKWISTTVANVKIEFTVNGGASWTTIVNSTPSLGSYTWNNIPDLNSQQCKIRISNVENGIPSDISDNNFKITNQVSLQVISPNGGESWKAGTNHDMRWTSTGISNVKLEYSTNNGLTWNLITANIQNTGAFTWSVPSLSTNSDVTQCLIKVSDAADNTIFDVSDGVFTVTPEPTIKVVSPDGGETLQSGSSQEIRWTSENVESVKIEYTTNAGAVWNPVIASTPSTGSYVWINIPSANSYQCKIRISDAVNGSPYDISDNNFTITNQTAKSIKVTSPNGGEKWREKQTKTITWTSNGVDRVNINYSIDGGRTWNLIVNNIESTGSYDWSIPAGINSTQCKIRISDTSDITTADDSDAPFSILLTPEIKRIIFPTNGTAIIAGQPVTILWESSGIASVKIEYNYKDISNPEDWITLVDSVQNSNSYQTSFSKVADNYVIRISATDNTASMNSGVFKVIPPPTITILAPNGGEQWLSNNSYEVSWRSNDIENVKIEYSTNGGFSWKLISNSTPSDGTYNWVPTDNDSSDNCVVRISEAVTGTPTDLSNDYFSVHKNKKVRVVSPNGGEVYKKSDKPIMEILWTTFAVANVNVYYSVDNGINWVVLLTNVQSVGAYAWDYPAILYSGQARIKVEDASNPLLYDVSDSFFYINVDKPVGSVVPKINSQNSSKKK